MEGRNLGGRDPEDTASHVITYNVCTQAPCNGKGILIFWYNLCMNKSSYNYLNDPNVLPLIEVHPLIQWLSNSFHTISYTKLSIRYSISHSANLTLKVIALGHRSKHSQSITLAVFPPGYTPILSVSCWLSYQDPFPTRFFPMILSWKMAVKQQDVQENKAIKE